MKLHQYKFGLLVTISAAVYLLTDLFGEFIGNLGSNYECLRFFGCTTGFFGWDAVEHFMSGFAILLFIVWWMRRYPKYSLLNGTWIRDAFIMICIISLIAIIWELIECAHDVFRLVVLHEQLRNIRLNIDLLDQPTNLDTMGDLAFNLVGAMIATSFIHFGHKKTVSTDVATV